LTGLAAVLIRLDDTAAARPALVEAVSLARTSPDGSALVGSLIYLGRLAAAEGDIESARRFLKEGELHARNSGDAFFLAKALLFLASIDIVENRLTRAEALLSEALLLDQERQDDFSIATTLAWLALAIGAAGDLPRAIGILQDCLERCSKLREPYPFFLAGVAIAALSGERTDAAAKAQLLGVLDELSQPGSLMPSVVAQSLKGARTSLARRLGRREYEASHETGKSMSLGEAIVVAQRTLTSMSESQAILVAL
jgi:tetratricopeptide (TPR) repeat protein